MAEQRYRARRFLVLCFQGSGCLFMCLRLFCSRLLAEGLDMSEFLGCFHVRDASFFEIPWTVSFRKEFRA